MTAAKPAAGTVGAVRIQRLSAMGMAGAEAHGKREDYNGKARSVTDAAPLTTSGLELAQLHADHIAGAKVQKSNTKALHMVLQFPTALVDGEDAAKMLRLSRAFASDVFGDRAVFADRVDRDEKSRHVVDLFLAPRYAKVTKRQTQEAVSTSRDLKALAAKHDKPPSLRGQGQALQVAWFEFLRDQADLDVGQGTPKLTADSDWRSPEELERDRIRTEATQAQEAASEAHRDADATFRQAEARKAAVEADLAQQVADAEERTRQAEARAALLETANTAMREEMTLRERYFERAFSALATAVGRFMPTAVYDLIQKEYRKVFNKLGEQDGEKEKMPVPKWDKSGPSF